MHPNGPFFTLSKNEYVEALKKHPKLNIINDITYETNSASASMHVSGNSYFANESFLQEVERLFLLLPFKKAFKNHKFILLVDNVRTQTAMEDILNDFGMKLGTRYPKNQIKYVDEKNTKQILHCCDINGKGEDLLPIARELGISVSKKYSLKDLKILLSAYSAFKNCKKNFSYI